MKFIELYEVATKSKDVKNTFYEAVNVLEVAMSQYKQLKKGDKFRRDTNDVYSKMIDILADLETGNYDA